jgi:hypothetical protein
MKKFLATLLILATILTLFAFSGVMDMIAFKIPVNGSKVKKIVDETVYEEEDEDFFGESSRNGYYKDEMYSYSFGNNVIVYYKNGAKQNAVKALEDGNIKITDFERFDVCYTKVRPDSFKIIDDSFMYDLKQNPQEFYRDDKYIYYFPEEKMQYITVEYFEGDIISFEEALKKDKELLNELFAFGVNYCKKAIKD